MSTEVDDDGGGRSVFAEALKVARQRKQISLRGMADALGCTSANVARIESSRNLKESTLLEYAKALGFDVEIRFVPRTAQEAEDGR